jgi:hypothetical protein
MKKLALMATYALLLLLSACASVPMASMDKDAKAKEFTPPPDKGAIYIYRNENLGGVMPVTVSINDKTLGQTAAYTYFHLNVPPGSYSLKSHAENVSELTVMVEPGRNYFVWQEMKIGMWSARTQLQEVDESTGRAAIASTKMIASSIGDDNFTAKAVDVFPAPSTENPAMISDKLRELQKLRDDGVISDEEFQKKKQQLLDKM